MLRTIVVVVTVIATGSGCGSLSRNHERGLAVVGAVTTLFGATTIADGMSCDTRYDVHSSCTSDAAELRDGALITTAGLALFGVAMWRLVTDATPDDAPRPRLVRTATPAPAQPPDGGASASAPPSPTPAAPAP